ncbi:hypothetical protein F4774DRAFT_425118 [Daldinia eschscholtzii]|nr:hypothetical protein F4774DRAFT_425118 [Daldinia eschscholtzii]
MSSNETNKSSWVVKQEQIDRFFDRVEKRRASAAFIQGPHACGKSTTMMAHILAQAQAKVPGAPVVYILPSSVESVILRQYLASDEFNQELPAAIANDIVVELPEDYMLSAGCLLITHYKQMLEWFSSNGKKFPFGNRAVIAMDIETNPTTDGEILLGRILEWASSCFEVEKPAAAVMVISPFASPRTEWILDYLVRRKPDVIRIPEGANPPIKFTPMGEPWEEDAAKMVAEATGPNATQGCLFGVTSLKDLMIRHDVEVLDGSTDPNRLVAFISEPRAILLHDHFQYSLPCNLQSFVSEDSLRERCFDLQTYQMIRVSRRKNRAEILKEQSWLLKSRVARESVVFYTTGAPSGFENLSDMEPSGTAYAADIYWTLLRLVGEWPSRTFTSMPVRRVPIAAAAIEIANRLCFLGCMTHSESGCMLTQKGSDVLMIKRYILPDVDFHVACLIASASHRANNERANVMRVIIRLAALLQVGIGNVYRKVDMAKQPSVDEVQRMCKGVGASLARKGALWIALGLWQATVHTGKEALAAYLTDDLYRMAFPAEWLMINPAAMKNAKDIVETLERAYDLQPFIDGEELSATELNGNEVIFIERELLSVYRHNVIVVSSDVRMRPFDVVSFQDVQISGEILNVRDQCEEGGLCLAIYSQLAMRGSNYFAHDITAISGDLLREVEEHTGVRIADTMVSTFTS